MRGFDSLLRPAMCLAAAAWLVGGVTAAEPDSTATGPASFTQPDLPRQYVDTTMPVQNGSEIRVRQGDSLQAALDAARPGDAIVLDAGASWAGGFTLPKKAGEGWIVVKTSAEDRLPPPGARATPADAPRMAKIVSDRNGRPALRAEQGACRWRFVGIEFTAAPEVAELSAIVELSHQSTELDDVPSHFVFDRVWIHGNPRLNSQRGLAINSRSTAVIDSWISECHFHGVDSQAICCWNGPGPFKIVNNFLEGGAENIMFGGAKNTAACMVPADVEIRRNHFYKNPAWFALKYPNNWVVKNLFEIKTARRVLLEGNVLENCWAEGQTGYAIVIKSSSPSQGQPWDTTSDVTIRHNRIVNCLNGVAIARWSSEGPVAPGAEPTSRVLVEHNLFERFGEACDFAARGRGGFMFQVAGRDFTFRHNTAWNDEMMLSLTKPACDNLAFVDNLVTPGNYGIHCDGGGGAWNGGLGTHLLGQCRMEGNAIIRAGSDRARKISPGGYPPENLWLDSFAAAGVDAAAYRLLPASKAKGAASDGTDPGADVDAVMAATSGVRAEFALQE